MCDVGPIFVILKYDEYKNNWIETVKLNKTVNKKNNSVR